MPARQPADDALIMALVGDLFVQREDPTSILALAAPFLRSADITFGNQEVVLSDRGTPIPGRVEGRFKSEPRMVGALTDAGFDAVGLANNHIMDYGPEALLQTLEVLDAAGIAHAGAGRNLLEAHKPAVVERKRTRVALLAYSSVFMPVGFAAEEDRPGIAVVRVHTAYQPPPRFFEVPGSPAIAVTTPDPSDYQRMIEDVRMAKEMADVVIVSWHWGISQGYLKIVGYQTELGRAAIEAGADLLVGHHPHVLQGIEVYRRGVICYSLGNFAFEMRSPHFARESILLQCQLRDKAIQQLSFLPVRINEEQQPEVLDLNRGPDIVQLMAELSAEFGTTLSAEGDQVVVTRF